MIVLLLLISQVQLQQDHRSRAQEVKNCTVNGTDNQLDAEEKIMLDKINAYRKNNGAGELKISPNLQRAATWLTVDMNAKKYLSHTDSMQRTFAVRIANCGYSGARSAENIAQSGPYSTATLEGWSKSAIHNQNLLNTQFTVIGIARAGDFWTIDLGSDDDSAAQPVPTALPEPSGTNPTFGVIQPCPSCASPTTAEQPAISESPIDTTIPSNVPEPSGVNDTDSPALPSPTDTKHSDPKSGGLLGLLLELIKIILEFLASLIGK